MQSRYYSFHFKKNYRALCRDAKGLRRKDGQHCWDSALHSLRRQNKKSQIKGFKWSVKASSDRFVHVLDTTISRANTEMSKIHMKMSNSHSHIHLATFFLPLWNHPLELRLSFLKSFSGSICFVKWCQFAVHGPSLHPMEFQFQSNYPCA